MVAPARLPLVPKRKMPDQVGLDLAGRRDESHAVADGELAGLGRDRVDRHLARRCGALGRR